MSLRPPDPDPGVPIWILSFGDMITNLLAFFILLQSFSHTQRAELLQTGDAPITTSITDLGGPQWLFGKRQDRPGDHRQKMHAMEADPDNPTPERIIDAEDENIRKLFDDLRRQAETQTSDGPRGRTRLFPTPLRFADAGSRLDAEAVDFLTTLSAELTQGRSSGRRDFYVVGMAPEAPTPKDQHILSAQRAQAVRECLARNLAGELARGSRLMAWGVGSGARGMNRATASPSPEIVIAVVESARED